MISTLIFHPVSRLYLHKYKDICTLYSSLPLGICLHEFIACIGCDLMCISHIPAYEQNKQVNNTLKPSLLSSVWAITLFTQSNTSHAIWHKQNSSKTYTQQDNTCRHTSAHCCSFTEAGYHWKAHLQLYSHTSVHIEDRIPIVWIFTGRNEMEMLIYLFQKHN